MGSLSLHGYRDVMRQQHPAVQVLLGETQSSQPAGHLGGRDDGEYATSLSLARAMAVGCLARLDPSLTAVNIWDPAAGYGVAGFTITKALESVGVDVRYRGQDINEHAVKLCRQRLEGVADAAVAVGDSLAHDLFRPFEADLVIVDAPWGLNWSHSAPAIESRRAAGHFRFGLPQQSDGVWLFISMAIEKLRASADGGGRVAALVNPAALSRRGRTADVRRQILEADLLESVTRLPEGLAPNTSIPLYLLTFSNSHRTSGSGTVVVADLQTEFISHRGRRSLRVEALTELESGLRTGRPGPRNRTVSGRKFIRRDARVTRTASDGHRLSWRLATFGDTRIDSSFLASRYGQQTGIAVDGMPVEIIDFDPGHILGDNARDLLREMDARSWPCVRLSSLLLREPVALTTIADESPNGQLFVSRAGHATAEPPDPKSGARYVSIRLDGEVVQPNFLAAWLNSELGRSEMRRTIRASSQGSMIEALRPDTLSLMRWADEMIVPTPEMGTQLMLASADERLRSFQVELGSQRESIWNFPETAEEVVSKLTRAFDDSLTAWLDQLPFPIASALWTAETAESAGEQQRAYFHAWEAIVAFHAIVLLSASRWEAVGGSEVETAIRATLQKQNLGMKRATFGTWIVIVEQISKHFRHALEGGDADEIARVRRAFGDLTSAGIENLISKELVLKFKTVNTKRNRWSGHSGYTSEDERARQVVSLVSDLSDLRRLLGNVWAQLVLVRAGSGKRMRDGFRQTVELAVGTRSPFARQVFHVGDLMMDGDLYLVKDGTQSPLRLGHFVQLRSAPSNAQYTTYFYNRTEQGSVHMVSYQYGPESEVLDDVETFRDEFGALVDGS